MYLTFKAICMWGWGKVLAFKYKGFLVKFFFGLVDNSEILCSLKAGVKCGY